MFYLKKCTAFSYPYKSSKFVKVQTALSKRQRCLGVQTPTQKVFGRLGYTISIMVEEFSRSIYTGGAWPSDEQWMTISLLNDEQMSNKELVEHQPII